MAGKSFILNKVNQEVSEMLKNKDYSIEKLDEILDRYSGIDNIDKIFESCEKFTNITESKIKYISLLINELYESDLFAKLLTPVLNRYPGILKELNIWLNDSEIFRENMSGFVDYMKKNYSMFSGKFFQYSLFENWTELEEDKFGLKHIIRTLEHFLILICAMGLWKSTGELNKKDFSVLIAIIDRNVDHSGNEKRKLIYDFMNDLCNRESFIANSLQMLII